MWNETNILSYEDFDSISDWAIPSLQWAVGAGVMKGRTDSTINPIENITRAEIAQMLVNYMGAVENYKNEIKDLNNDVGLCIFLIVFHLY